MDDEKIIRPERVRTNEGSFAFIPHRFLRGGFFASCEQDELCLYLLFVLASDRHGISYYGRQKLSKLVRMEPERIRDVVRGLRRKDLIAVDGMHVQVLSLPADGVGVDRKSEASAAGVICVSEALHAYVEQLTKGHRP